MSLPGLPFSILILEILHKRSSSCPCTLVTHPACNDLGMLHTGEEEVTDFNGASSIDL